MKTPTNFVPFSHFRLSLVISIAFALSARPIAQTADEKPTLHVIMEDRSPAGATELGTARARAAYIFRDAGVRISWTTRSEALDIDHVGNNRVDLVVLDGRAADDVFRGDGHVLGFAIPSATRVYVHYGRVHALARRHRVPPGWFLGVVFAHELGHVLLPGAAHSTEGVMAPTVRPDSQVLPTFTREQAQSFRARLRHRTVDREGDEECPHSDRDGS